MRHYTHSVNIPLDKNEIDLSNEPKPIPWSHSSEESNCYINFYRSWLECTIKVTANGGDTHSNYCDMMFEIKDRKIVINNCQLLSTIVNARASAVNSSQQLSTAVNFHPNSHPN